MDIPFKRIVWNEHETSLLIDAFEQVRCHAISRNEAITHLSKRLRNRMILDGIAINEKYRNVAGIDLQLLSIECSVNEEGVIKEDNQLSGVFYKVLWQSINERSLFEDVLKQANLLYPEIDEPTVVLSTQSVAEYPFSNFNDNQAIVAEPSEIQYVQEPVCNWNAINTDSKEKELKQRIQSILIDKFPKGFRLGSTISYKRFSSIYTSIYNEEILIDIDNLEQCVKECGIQYRGLVYVPLIMLDEETKNELFEYIEQQFAQGISCIYYNVLFEIFSQQFLGQTMIDGEMLRLYLEFYNEDGEYHFDKQKFSKGEYAKVDINAEVLDYVKAQGGCVTEGEVVKALSYLPKVEVIEAFSTNRQTLVLASMKTRFHIDNFQLEDVDKIAIINYLEQEIADMQYVTFTELFDKMAAISPRVIDNNMQFTQTGIRTALSSILGNDFCFIGSFISSYDNPVSIKDAYIGMGRGRESFSIEEVQDMATDFKTPINFEALAEHNIRISEEKFVRKDTIHFDVDAIDNAIALFCPGEFISISEVNTFAAFHDCGYRWTPFLLESYLFSYSKLFSLKHMRFNKSTVTGAIVRNSSHFGGYTDIMAVALAKADVKLDKTTSLTYLSEKGFIERRRLKTIDEVIKRAKILKIK